MRHPDFSHEKLELKKIKPELILNIQYKLLNLDLDDLVI